MTEKFCLKWNDFHSNVSKSFSLLRNEDYLHDVTLVSDDHKKVSAHKLVLSACSEYFKDIFKNNQHSHPLLCLGGISIEDLNNIMDYIYNGEVQIHQENLDRFLDIAQRLKLEGLIGGNPEEGIEDNKDSINEFIPNIEETESKFSEQRSVIKPSKKNNTMKLENPVRIVAASNDVDEQINQYLEECSDGNYRCTFCGKTCTGKTSKRDTQRHIETHIDGLSYECPTCNKTFRSRNSLKCHKYMYHR